MVIKHKSKLSKVKAKTSSIRENTGKIVGIGASAGGLESLEKFFDEIPPGGDLAFVVVSHMGTPQKSILPELIQRHTKLAVSQVKNRQIVRPGHIYVISPGHSLTIAKNVLRLVELPRTHEVKYPIDTFFRSLALDRGRNAIGIILSGTGTDGTLGLKEIKRAGGMTMAQDPVEAKYDGMPRSALDSGFAEHCLPVKGLAGLLIGPVGRKRSTEPKKYLAPANAPQDFLDKIIGLIQKETKHDLSQYKPGTITRRIERRIGLHRMEDIAHYYRYLEGNPKEIKILFQDMLIGVTSFFRDKEAFAELRDKVVPQLAKGKDKGHIFRIWVPGCSSGEEAYSLAILFDEFLEKSGKTMGYQVFATDIDEIAVAKARSGIFPESIVKDVSPARLKKYFTKNGADYTISKSIREKVVFAVQNIIHDAPFSRLDLVSCRNLLIYLGPDLQKRLFPLFHYTLNPGGILFLGSSETIGNNMRLFSVMDKKWKIYKAIAVNDKDHLKMNIALELANKTVRPGTGLIVNQINMPKKKAVPIASIAQKLLIANYAPVSVIINEQGDILYVHGQTGKFLQPAEGEANLNIFEMAREGLRVELRSTVRRSLAQKKTLVRKGLRVKQDDGYRPVDVTALPVNYPELGQKLVMIAFDEVPAAGQITGSAPSKNFSTSLDQRVKALEGELQNTKEDLQSTIEELEASNEELKSSVEELQSSNEELHSTNEELETSREELQSLNEELNTLNAQQQSKVDELYTTQSDLKNLFNSTKIATIFLDSDLNIRRFTPEITSLINVIDTDIGRPISDIATHFENIDFPHELGKVAKDLAAVEKEVKMDNGNCYHVRISPYRSVANVIDGVVVTFTDITEKRTLRRLAAVVMDSNDAVLVQDFDGNILAWNKGAQRTYGWTESEAVKMNIDKLIPESARNDTRDTIEQVRQRKTPLTVKAKRQNNRGEVMEMSISYTLLIDDQGQADSIATTEQIIPAKK